MSVKAQLQSDMKEAMKSKDKERLTAIRLVYSEVRNKEIDQKTDLKDEDALALVQKEIKQTQESLEGFEKVGNEEKVAEMKQRIDILTAYLPKQMTEEEIRNLIVSLVAEHQIAGKSGKGQLMKVLMPQVRGKSDGKLVNKVVDEVLQ